MSIRKFLKDIKLKFKDQNPISLETFSEILYQLGDFDENYALSSDSFPDLYNAVLEEQNQNITIESIESFILQFLVNERQSIIQMNMQAQQEMKQQNNEVKQYENEEQFLIDNLEPDQLTEFKRIFTLIQNDHEGEKDNLENFSKEIINYDLVEQKLFELNPSQVCIYLFQQLKNEKKQILVSDFFKKITELESNMYNHFQELDQKNEQEKLSQQKQQKQQQKNSNLIRIQTEEDDEDEEDYNNSNYRNQHNISQDFNGIYQILDSCKSANVNKDKKQVESGLKKVMKQCQYQMKNMKNLINDLDKAENSLKQVSLQLEYEKQKNTVLQNDLKGNEDYRINLENDCDDYVQEIQNLNSLLHEKDLKLVKLEEQDRNYSMLENQLNTEKKIKEDLNKKLKKIQQERDEYYNKNLLFVENEKQLMENQENHENVEKKDKTQQKYQQQVENLLADNQKFQMDIRALSEQVDSLQFDLKLKEEAEMNMMYQNNQQKNKIQELTQQQQTSSQNNNNNNSSSYQGIRPSMMMNQKQSSRFSMARMSTFGFKQSMMGGDNQSGNSTPMGRPTIQQNLFLGRQSSKMPSQKLSLKIKDEDEDEFKEHDLENMDTIEDPNNINWGEVTKKWVNGKIRDSLIGPRKSLTCNNNQKVQFKFLQFDEAALFARDYLNLRENQYIKQILQKFAEDRLENLNNLKSFSDNIYRINQKERREKRIIFISSMNMYILHPKKNYKVIRRIELEKIEKITFSETSSSLCAIHVKNEYDYLIEIYRRSEMNLFLIELFKERHLPQFKMEFRFDFKVKFRDSHTASIQSLNQENLLKQYEGAYKDAVYLGFLQMQKSGFFGKSWQEKFVVLSSIGLLVFDEPGQSKSQLIPVAGSYVFMSPQSIKEPNSLKICYAETDQEFYFLAQSKTDQDAWFDAIHKVVVESFNANTMGKEERTYTEETKKQKESDILIDM